jgi:protein-S-isoprenylcysteine O-methyltransferase Ste14
MKTIRAPRFFNPFSIRHSTLSNISLAAIFLLATAYLIRHYAETGQLSLILMVVFYGLSFICALVRRPAKDQNVRLFSRLFTFAGIALPMVLIPNPTNDMLIGHLLQLGGIGISIAGLLSLNKSFGLVAANRGIISNGLYRFVRHPLYSSYELSIVGFIINNFGIYNIAIACIHLACQLQRIKYEEDLLGKDPEYRNYTRQTRWRFFPFVY